MSVGDTADTTAICWVLHAIVIADLKDMYFGQVGKL